jgi:DNA replication protein DnaC
LTRCPDCGHLAERARRRRVYRRKRKRIEQYTQRVGRYERQTFETFARRNGEAKTASVQEALEAALRFAEDPAGWLVLTGTKGTGKTHLASAICNRLVHAAVPEERKPLVLYLTAPDLLDLLRSGYDRDDHAELLDLCRSVDVLILDDLGVESGSSEWVREKLYSVVNYRYQAKLPTVVVTNERLVDLPPRLRDRLADDALCTHIKVIAPSWRQRKSAPGTIVW